MNGFSIVAFRKRSFSDDYFEVTLLYKKNSLPQVLFLSQLQDLLCSEQIQIITGNFNTDAFDSNNYASLSNSLETYSMFVRDPTYLSGSLIDVYLPNVTLDKVQATATIKNIYFCDHDAVNLELRCIHYFFSEKLKKLFHAILLICIY